MHERETRTQAAEPLRRLRLFLRSPRTILVEVGAAAVFGVLLASVPQVGAPADHDRWRELYPLPMRLVEALWLDRIATSPGFLALLACAAGSLAIVIAEQVRRVRRQWRAPVAGPDLPGAQYRVRFERAARGGGAGARLETTGRVGPLGSPLFHVGLMIVMIAAAGRALFWSEAIVDLVEGETLPAGSSGYAAGWKGFLARPFALEVPFRVEDIRIESYPSGETKGVAARAALGSAPVELGVNRPVRAGTTSLYVTQALGPAAVVRWTAGGTTRTEAVLLRLAGETFEGRLSLGGSAEVLLRKGQQAAGILEVRVLDGGALVAGGELRSGEGLRLRDAAFELLDVRRWARFQGGRDPCQPLAFLGFGVMIAGAALLALFVRVDVLVSVEPAGDRERVAIALRAQRFAPLFVERFQQVVAREGGPRPAATPEAET